MLIVGIFLLRGVVGAIKLGKPFSPKQIVISAVSKGLATDSYGHTNILVVGVGGEGHDGEDLTDTMILASLDHKQNLVPMLSIPRDLFVHNEAVGWGTRINSVYEYVYDDTESRERAMEELIREIENITHQDIHYYLKIDFEAAVATVDSLGGIELTLDDSFYDPYYPAPSGSSASYQTFSLSAGTQTLDGDTALKYARSRKTSSDFDRAIRQQEIIQAVKDKALSLGVLLNPVKIKNAYYSIASHIESNLTLSEMLNLAGFASDLEGRESILTNVINDAPFLPAGFLYTPERELYDGAFVLVPYTNDFTEIQTFAQLYFYHPEVFINQTPIQILNGTATGGLAGLSKMMMIRYGFNIEDYTNAESKDITTTKVYTRPPLDEEGNPEKPDKSTAELIPSLIPGDYIEELPEKYSYENWETDAEIIIELGTDFVDYYNENPETFYVGFY